MKKLALMILGISISPLHLYGQDWQAAFMLDSRSGYLSNTYLNPTVAEWDRNEESGYFMLTPIAQIMAGGNSFNVDLTAGGLYESFFGDYDDWYGAFSTVSMRHRLNRRVAIGMETGASAYSTVRSRSLFWIQPVLTWSPGVFTTVSLKAGSSFREVRDELDGEEFAYSDRFDSYSLEMLHFPSFRTQIRAGLFGSLDQPFESVGARLSVTRRAGTGWQLSARAGYEHYGYQVISETGGGGFPPQPPQTEVFNEADRIFRAGPEIEYALSGSFTVTAGGDYMYYHSTAADESITDYHVFAGLRYSITRPLSGRSGARVEWRSNERQTVVLSHSYSGDGQLYITGEFNNWEHPGIPLSRQSHNRYVAQLALDPGAYEYKILLIEGDEETWVDLSDETYTVPDGFGGYNGLIFID